MSQLHIYRLDPAYRRIMVTSYENYKIPTNDTQHNEWLFDINMPTSYLLCPVPTRPTAKEEDRGGGGRR